MTFKLKTKERKFPIIVHKGMFYSHLFKPYRPRKGKLDDGIYMAYKHLSTTDHVVAQMEDPRDWIEFILSIYYRKNDKGLYFDEVMDVAINICYFLKIKFDHELFKQTFDEMIYGSAVSLDDKNEYVYYIVDVWMILKRYFHLLNQ